MQTYISHNENDTKNLAIEIAKNLHIGDIVVLTGELGSGKTKFTEGFLSYFHLEKEISSPTFTIVNEYHQNEIAIYHFDVYRLEDIDEVYAIGGEDYFSQGISIIEWGEKIESILPKPYIKISFKKIDDSTRKLIIEHIQ